MRTEVRVRINVAIDRLTYDERGALVDTTRTDEFDDTRYYTATWGKHDSVRRLWRTEAAERGRALAQRAVETVITLLRGAADDPST